MNLSNYCVDDTIVAIATCPSPSALGVIKVSGRQSIAAVSHIFQGKKDKNLEKAKTFTLHYGWIKDSKQQLVDEVLVSIMRAPHSYTCEDVVEVSCHGGVVVLNKIVELIKGQGARLAKPGEFSYRALVNGRIDLMQLQAISDIVEAKTEKALFSYSKRLGGDFSRQIAKIKKDLTRISSTLEASINFADHDIAIDIDDIGGTLSKIKDSLEKYIKDSQASKVLRQGVNCVICGRANAGKSTLFNCLLKEERVIVTHIPGTTRDAVEETINIGGIPLRIHDTAGIFATDNFIEKEAMGKSYSRMGNADIILAVIDGQQQITQHELELFEEINSNKVIFVVNKIDLNAKPELQTIKRFKRPIVLMSAKFSQGLDNLEQAILENVYAQGISGSDNPLLLAQWQRDILQQLLGHISSTLDTIKQKRSLDFIHFSLLPALEDLSRINGEVIDQKLLENIFNNFCIGK
jgi:tRNA modification GTPase